MVITAIIGGILGYAYYHFIGCSSGGCPITSSPYLSVFFGVLLGLAIGSNHSAIYADVQNIDAKKATEFIQENAKNTNLVILDLRTPEEYAEGHIQNSKNINFYAADFEQQLQSLNKTHTYFIYCRTGRRSSNALSLFKKLGFENIVHLKKGIVDWQSAGYPVIKN